MKNVQLLRIIKSKQTLFFIIDFVITHTAKLATLRLSLGHLSEVTVPLLNFK